MTILWIVFFGMIIVGGSMIAYGFKKTLEKYVVNGAALILFSVIPFVIICCSM